MPNIIKELSNAEAYKLIGALDYFESKNVPAEYAHNIYITADGKYHFTEGNDFHELVDLDSKIPAEAALLKLGKKQKKIQLPGKYIARKRVIKEYSREEVMGKKDEIFQAFKKEQKVLKERQKAEAGEDSSPVQVITEALQKLSKRG